MKSIKLNQIVILKRKANKLLIRMASIKIIKNILINYDTSKLDYVDFIKRSRIKLSSLVLGRLYYSINEEKLSSVIIENYRNYRFNIVINMVDLNIGLLILNGNYNTILKGALSTNDPRKIKRYVICSILTNLNVLDTVGFAHLRASDKYGNVINEALLYCLNSHILSENKKTILSAYMNLDINECIDKMSPNAAIKLHLMNGNWDEINKLHKIGQLNYNNKKILNTVFMSNVNTGDLDSLNVLYKKYYNRISNSNLCNYHFSKGDFVSGYKEMKNRDMSVKCRGLYRNVYKQCIDSIPVDSNLIVINSWGVGDDIRYSSLIPQLSHRFKKLQITCEPRLYLLFTTIYPRVKFVKANRTKVITINNYEEYNRLPSFELHHLMDNRLAEKISSEAEYFTLMTDVINQLDPVRSKVELLERLTPKVINKNGIDKFISDLNDENKLLIGICWRSMISGSARNDHYFELDEILKCAKGRQIVLVCLQYDIRKKDLSIATNSVHQIDFHVPPIDLKNDFVSVLYLMTKLDFIVSAGTAVLELAGLSGTKTFLLSNSYVQKYRFNECNNLSTLTDRWFNNIEIVKDFENLSKAKVLESTFNLIKKQI
ncbi:hypothetical protein BCT86_14480 [Vibrio breoganii]|uniref:hypothetical protein n=1 Tax=Vibrio breoganii TaxID=553239 RepID=UPI000C82605E|nr:hypothetical protein [Vibrio breoganii]PML04864.1 hypothetical protein BCT86_14480 [Vibrio breoganii]